MKEVQARIVDDLVEVIGRYFDFFEMDNYYANDKDFLKLRDRIQGQVVTLVFTGYDAFEKEDNNYWLPDCCFEIIED